MRGRRPESTNRTQGTGVAQRADHTGTKRCYKCGEHKSYISYYPDKTRKDGLRSLCKSCQSLIKYRSNSSHGADDGYYLRQLRIQDGVCAVCQRPERSPKRRRLAIDHDHVSGRLRGLLCMSCNTSLGKLGDSVESIERVLAYLKGELTYD